MSDPYIIRDREGNPLSSVFHKPPCSEWVPKSMKDMNKDPIYLKIVEVLDKIFPPIEEFHPNDIEPKEEDKK